MLVDLTPGNVTGKDAAAALDRASITVNKNAIPLRHQESVRDLRHPRRHARRDHPRHEGAGDGADRRLHHRAC
jgi:hypothetical protein